VEETKKVAKTVVSEERKKRNYWNDKECQIKVEGRNKARIKMLNRRTRINTVNCKNERRESQEYVYIKSDYDNGKIRK
jgi:hypothetical protein